MQDSYGELPRIGCAGAFLPEADRGLFPRKRLVSLLLRDRSVLRVICAPFGFGKTSLVRQYAQEVFDDIGVMYIDGNDPSFICLLDKESSPWDHAGFVNGQPDLIVVDDLPLLDDVRARVFSDCIDTLIQAHCEVVVTTVPAHDCLGTRQSDRVLVGAYDLLVTDSEYADLLSRCEYPLMEGELIMQYRGIPSLVWTASPFAVLECIDGFFREDLPEEFMLPSLAMLLLEAGKVEDLEAVGLPFPPDELSAFSQNYPQFGISILRSSFATVPFSLAPVASRGCEMLSSFADRTGFFEKIARFLLGKNRLERAMEVITLLCTEHVRIALLKEYAWLLLDSTRPLLLRSALDTVSKASFEHSAKLRVIDAWSYYVTGNHYAASLLLSRQSAREVKKPYLILALAVLGFLIEFEQQFQGGFCDAGAARAPRHYAAIIETVLKSCRMQCQGFDGQSQCAYAGQMSADQQDRCAQWSTLAYALLLFKKYNFPSTCGSADAKGSDAVVAMLKKLLHAQPSGIYCFALHVALLCLPDAACSNALALQTLLSQVIVAPLATGIHSFSSAILFMDAQKLGMVGGNAAASSAAAARACADARMVIRDRLRLLGQSPALAQLGIEAVDDMQGDASREPLGLPQLSCALQAPQPLHEVDRCVRTSAEEVIEVVAERIPPMQVRMFGGFEVLVGTRPVADDLWHQRGIRLLVSHLILSKGCNVPREKIYALFWPDSDYVHARDSFYAAWKLARLLFPDGSGGTPYFTSTATSCSVNTELVDADIYEFDRLSRGILTQKLSPEMLLGVYLEMDALYKGKLLCGEYMNEYLEGMRQYYVERYVTAMVTASGCAIQHKDASKALWFAGQAVQEDPLREDANHALMRAQLTYGQSSCAVRTYQQYKENLQRKLGADPSNNIVRLFDELRSPYGSQPDISIARA